MTDTIGKATLSAKIKKLTRSVTDRMYRGNYDKGQLNMALLADAEAEELEQKMAQPDAMADFQRQLDDYNATMKTSDNNKIPLIDLPKIEPSQSVTAAVTASDEKQSDTPLSAVIIAHALGTDGEDNEAESKNDDKPDADSVQAKIDNDFCYYILLKHTKTYPAKGSLVMLRCCDYAYVWTDNQEEDEKPSYRTCPCCGRVVSHFSSEME